MSLGLNSIVAEALDTVRDLDIFTTSIRYERAGKGSVLIGRVLQSKTETEQQLGSYVPTNYRLMDFLFPGEWLILGGKQVLPKVGDVIKLLDKDGTPTGDEFTVSHYFDDRTHRHSETGMTQLRIHTKQSKGFAIGL